jgi:hypothetical protein
MAKGPQGRKRAAELPLGLEMDDLVRVVEACENLPTVKL